MITALIIIAIVIVVAFTAAILVIITRVINLQMRLNDVARDCNLRLNNMAEGNQILTKEVRECQEKVDAINQPLPSGKGKKPTTANRNKEILDQSQRLLSKIQE